MTDSVSSFSFGKYTSKCDLFLVQNNFMDNYSEQIMKLGPPLYKLVE